MRDTLILFFFMWICTVVTLLLIDDRAKKVMAKQDSILLKLNELSQNIDTTLSVNNSLKEHFKQCSFINSDDVYIDKWGHFRYNYRPGMDPKIGFE